MFGVSDFWITVRAVDPRWRCVINASAQSLGEPAGTTFNRTLFCVIDAAIISTDVMPWAILSSPGQSIPVLLAPIKTDKHRKKRKTQKNCGNTKKLSKTKKLEKQFSQKKKTKCQHCTLFMVIYPTPRLAHCFLLSDH